MSEKENINSFISSILSSSLEEVKEQKKTEVQKQRKTNKNRKYIKAVCDITCELCLKKINKDSDYLSIKLNNDESIKVCLKCATKKDKLDSYILSRQLQSKGE